MNNIYPKLMMAVALVLCFIGMPVRMDAQYATERIDYKRGTFYDAEGWKLGDEQNSSLLFRVSAVLEAIETGECNRKRKYAPDPTPADIKEVANAS